MSQPSGSQPLRCLPHTGALQEMEEEYEANSYEEPRDELYCVMNSKIVGVNYYKGLRFGVFFLHSI